MTESLAEVVVESVRVHMLSSQHVVLLKETDRERYLPIWIGPWEANAIAARLQGVTSERPMTHDLFATTLGTLGVELRRVIVSSLTEETFHATLELERDGQTYTVDARPSDALALAVRTGVRIYASIESWTGPASSPTLRSTSASRSSASSSTRLAWTWTKNTVRALGQTNRPGSNRGPACRPRARPSLAASSAEDRFASTHPLAPPEPQPEPQRPEVADRPEDDRGLGAGGRTGRARVVRYPHLREPASLEAELD